MTVAIPPRRPEPTLNVLVQAGLLTAEQAGVALKKAQKSGDRIEDLVVDLQLVSEADLLRALAQQYRAQFVTTQKLAAAEVSKAVLDLVAPEIAESHACMPIFYDEKTRVLLVATPDPDNPIAQREIQASARADKVTMCLARPAAVRAAILRWYHNNPHAFAVVDRTQLDQYHQLMDQFERNIIDRTTPVPQDRRESGAAAPDEHVEEIEPEEVDVSTDGDDGDPRAAIATPPPRVAPPPVDVAGILNVLVSLLEAGRAELRGHSSMAARLCRRLAERMDLSHDVREALVLAAYLHDVGKTAQYHLTALNVSEYEGHRVVAKKTYLSPVRMFEGVRLPHGTLEAIEFMYERIDGKGLPGQHRGTEIPLGARLLAIVDTYADLLVNPRNPFRKALSASETFEAMARYRDKIFDGNILDLLRLTSGGDDLRQRLLAERPTVLIVDPDAEQTTILELRLLESDFDVRIARSADQAMEMVENGEADAVVTEVNLDPFDGFAFVEKLRGGDKTRELPVVFLTGRAAREDIARGFELGAADYMTKPMSADVLVAKLRKILEGRARGAARGVNGSLREMALPDIVQVLFHGRKNGLLKLRSPKGNGEIHFDGGRIVNASFGKADGEEAFYAMLGLADGDFVLDPNFKPTAKKIEVSPEMLLLEGLRRLDESRR